MNLVDDMCDLRDTDASVIDHVLGGKLRRMSLAADNEALLKGLKKMDDVMRQRM